MLSLANLTYVSNYYGLSNLLEISNGYLNTARMMVGPMVASFIGAGIAAIAAQTSCPGYNAVDIRHTASGLTANLQLAGAACNLYGIDIPELTLTVEYQTDARLHILIEDIDRNVYQVPNYVVPRPHTSAGGSAATSQLKFNYTTNPFTFTVSRATGEVLFDTKGTPLVFESQYLYLRTSLPQNPYLYGLGEHSDPFRLNTTNYTRTIWARDSYSIPSGTNLYGSHPIYLDHRGLNGSHGVVLVSSNGMDIKIDNTGGQHLEYNVLGGVFDFYFVAGPSPIDVAQQIAEVVGLPAMIPYSGLGYHNCRYGYRDVYEVAEVVHNYSSAGIPLETMWTDIDYMYLRRVFTLDPERYPIAKVRELIEYLHAHQQKYVLMVDPAVGVNSSAYTTGNSQGIFLKVANGSDYKGVVWPGVAAFPDWFEPNTQSYWTNEFLSFFDGNTGVDIDYLWIDMNEPANFCYYPCLDPDGFAVKDGDPPMPPPVRTGPTIPLPGFPSDLQPSESHDYQLSNADVSFMRGLSGREQIRSVDHAKIATSGLPNRELINPPYKINNAAGSLANRSLDTSLVHHGGFVEYDTHNLYGTMMSNASRHAMLARRPGVRPLVVTRSTFLGAGSYVAHWLGDNLSNWPQYRISIGQMLQFASIFQVPMVGSDVCGFGSNTTETLCARWMMLGAFYPFYRNHNDIHSIPQEPYRWSSVAAASKYAIDIRYRLMDYIYTSFWRQSQTGKPLLNPVFYLYPDDSNTFDIEHQFFYGDALLVSPVIEENSTSVELYLPNDIFYDWNNGLTPVRGRGQKVVLRDVGFQTIPLHVRGGTILPMRARSANTTTELRKHPFHIIVAPGLDGSATGSLYLDEGSMIVQPATSVISMAYSDGSFAITGTYDYSVNTMIESISILGITGPPTSVSIAGTRPAQFQYNATSNVLVISCQISLMEDVNLRVIGSS